MMDVLLEMLPVVGWFAGAGVFAIFVMHLSNSVLLSRQRPGLEQLARRLGTTLVRPPTGIIPRLPSMTAVCKGRSVEISIWQLKGNDAWLLMKLPVKRVGNLYVEITRRNALTKMLWNPDAEITTGDPALDEAIRVSTNEPDAARRLFTSPSIRRKLRLHTNEPYMLHLKIRDGMISYFSRGVYSNPDSIYRFHQIVDVAATFADILERKPVEAENLPDRMRDAALRAQLAAEKIQSRAEKNWPDDGHYMERLLRNFFGGKWETKGDATSYSISHQKRLLILCYKHEPAPAALDISLTTIQKFWIRILPQTGSDTETELRTGNGELDDSFRIHSGVPEVATRFLLQDQVARAILDLPDFSRFEIHHGRATLTIQRPGAQGFRRSHLDRTLQQLMAILDAYARQELLRIAVASPTSEALCPYCRGELESEVVQCSACRTPHHSACWNENTQCTTWGCSSTTAG